MGKQGWTIAEFDAFQKKKPKYKVTFKSSRGTNIITQNFVLKKDANYWARINRERGRKQVKITKL